ncbi:calvin cycle protein CP12-1, chloroplastic-like [Lolium perenne]|uniref:calvin cycle protein CP12-1, chloroplastic-like n=1 Tax=Lolium perenne TaxID=4522 RepID=UPI0013E78427|nr:calvin cycle protein CP12-1, chloroplastic-like [Lolium perenne]
MASALTNVSLSTFAAAARGDVLARPQGPARVTFPAVSRVVACRAGGPATPPGISDKVSESIKDAQEACSDDSASGECAAAWDEVEELSAAASHARDKLKDSDPLENYCKENPETDECRTYDS